jgi:hypothetical protein
VNDDHLSLPNLELQGQKFLERLRVAASLNLDYWTRGKSGKPNLPLSAFLVALVRIPEPTDVFWEDRKSQKGKNAQHGEDRVWQFEFDLEIFGTKAVFYLKGYFFTRWKLGGVTIQSFRSVVPESTPLRRK